MSLSERVRAAREARRQAVQKARDSRPDFEATEAVTAAARALEASAEATGRWASIMAARKHASPTPPPPKRLSDLPPDHRYAKTFAAVGAAAVAITALVKAILDALPKH